MKFHSATELISTNQSSVKCTASCISYGAHKHKTRLCFEVKQTQFLPEFHHIIGKK